MIFIETIEQYSQFLKIINNKNIIILPTFVNPIIHYNVNKISFLFIDVEGEIYILGFDHPELINLSIELLNQLKPKSILTINQKYLTTHIKDVVIKDIGMWTYLNYNKLPDWNLDTSSHLYFNRKFSWATPILNKIIPLTKHIELHQKNCEKINEIVDNIPEPLSLQVYTRLVGAITNLESNGIKVNRNLLIHYYGKRVIPFIDNDDLVYGNYNFYTLTGRPSNTFGNINFSAIDKSTGVRKSFIPRNDYFILFDYDSFHLNLIARIIQYKFDEDNLHTCLGKYYYNKSTLTDEEYNETKKKNFKYLYGGIPKEIRDKIPFFASVQTFVFSMWREIKAKGYYTSPLTKRKIVLSAISNPNATKVFNYFIQLIETETNLIIIQRLENYLKDKKTKLILYTYDSFLFDIDKSDRKDVIENITKILNVFPMKIYVGNNYDDMELQF